MKSILFLLASFLISSSAFAGDINPGAGTTPQRDTATEPYFVDQTAATGKTNDPLYAGSVNTVRNNYYNYDSYVDAPFIRTNRIVTLMGSVACIGLYFAGVFFLLSRAKR